jgi:hypothetical protein
MPFSRLLIVAFSFRSVYSPYKYLLSLTSDERVKRFLSEDRELPELKQKLEELYTLISAVAKMDIHIPMELFSLDCTAVNQVRVGK